MKIYIAGKITGNPNYKEDFTKAEKELKAAGHIVMNPAILPEGFTWADYMTICIPMLQACEAIYLLRNWKNSKGAKQERAHAEKIGRQVLYEGGSLLEDEEDE